MAAETLGMIVSSAELGLPAWNLVQKQKAKKIMHFQQETTRVVTYDYLEAIKFPLSKKKTLEDIEKHVEGIKDSEIQ
jgi:hypothetical protein